MRQMTRIETIDASNRYPFELQIKRPIHIVWPSVIALLIVILMYLGFVIKYDPEHPLVNLPNCFKSSPTDRVVSQSQNDQVISGVFLSWTHCSDEVPYCYQVLRFYKDGVVLFTSFRSQDMGTYFADWSAIKDWFNRDTVSDDYSRGTYQFLDEDHLRVSLPATVWPGVLNSPQEWLGTYTDGSIVIHKDGFDTTYIQRKVETCPFGNTR